MSIDDNEHGGDLQKYSNSGSSESSPLANVTGKDAVRWANIIFDQHSNRPPLPSHDIELKTNNRERLKSEVVAKADQLDSLISNSPDGYHRDGVWIRKGRPEAQRHHEFCIYERNGVSRRAEDEPGIIRLEYGKNSSIGQPNESTAPDPNRVLSVGGLAVDPEIAKKMAALDAAGDKASRVSRIRGVSTEFIITPQGEVEVNVVVPPNFPDSRVQQKADPYGNRVTLIPLGQATSEQLGFMGYLVDHLADVVPRKN